MPLLCFGSDQHWFRAIAKNDVEFVRAHFNRAGTYQTQCGDPSYQIPGFSGLHCAVVYNAIDVFRLLLHKEFMLRTRNDTVLQTPMIKTANFRAVSGQDALGLAIIVGNFTIVKEILQQPQARQLLNQTDDCGCSHWMLLNEFNVDPKVMDGMLDTILTEEFPVNDHIGGALYIIALQGRLNNLRATFKLLAREERYVESFYIQLCSVYEGRTVLDLAQQTENLDRRGTSVNEKQQILKLLVRCIPQAIHYFQKDPRRWGKVLSRFFEACKVQYDIDLGPANFSELATMEMESEFQHPAPTPSDDRPRTRVAGEPEDNHAATEDRPIDG